MRPNMGYGENDENKLTSWRENLARSDKLVRTVLGEISRGSRQTGTKESEFTQTEWPSSQACSTWQQWFAHKKH